MNLLKKYKSEIKLMCLVEKLPKCSSSYRNLEKTREEIAAHPEHSLEMHIGFLEQFIREAKYGPKETCETCEYNSANLLQKKLFCEIIDFECTPEQGLTEEQKEKFQSALEGFENEEEFTLHCVLLNQGHYESNGIICPNYKEWGTSPIREVDFLRPYAELKLKELKAEKA